MSALAAGAAAHRDAVGAVYRAIPRTVWLTILVAWLIAYLLWDMAPQPALLVWAGSLTAINLARLGHALWRMARAEFLRDPRRHARELSAGMLIANGGLAAGFLLFLLDAPLVDQSAFALFAVAMCAGSATVLTGCRAAFIAYNAPGLVTITLVMLWAGVTQGDAERGFFGVMMAVFGIVMYRLQKRLNSALLESLRARYEKEALLEQKDARLAELEHHNRELSADRDEFLAASLTDGLTGLANRRHFDRTLARDWERSRREGTPLACIMLDIDHFKHFNDRYGHMAGDDCLRAIAGVIGETVSRGGDFSARYGGEEFVVLLPGTGIEGAHLIAERIRAAVEERGIPHAGGPGRVVTLSAGVAVLTPGSRFPSAQSLVDLADEGLYEAKERGRNRVVVRDGNDAVPVPGGLTPVGT